MADINTRKKREILYGKSDKMPPGPLILASLQHVLMAISVGLALPVAITTAAGVDVFHSGAYLAATILGMGIVTFLQSIKGKFIGTGYLSISVTDSAAIGCCVLAAEVGGIPLVIGMSIFSGILKFVLANCAFSMRKLFPPEASGTLIIIVGINLIPTAFKYSLGTGENAGGSNVLVAALTFVFIIVCVLFIKPLKPYAALVGIGFGYILALIFGVFDTAAFSELANSSVVGLPIYPELHYDFSWSMVLPFAIITLASVIDNIGDFSATQSAAEPERQKPDWKSITKGIRSGGIGNALSSLFGASLQSTATANIGVARATGIVSRYVAILAAGLLAVISFFPQATGFLSIIPKPVLGAVVLFSLCYIMAGGFSTIQSRELDDRKTFTIFATIAAAISTLIPGLYDFLPETVSSILVSPMVMGTCVLIVLTLICKIGTKKHYEFTTGVSASEIKDLDEKIENVCRSWGTERVLCRKLQITTSSLCEAFYEMDPASTLLFSIKYDEMQIGVILEVQSDKLPEATADMNKTGESVTNFAAAESEIQNPESLGIGTLSVTLKMLKNMFDNLKFTRKQNSLFVKMEEDL